MQSNDTTTAGLVPALC